MAKVHGGKGSPRGSDANIKYNDNDSGLILVLSEAT